MPQKGCCGFKMPTRDGATEKGTFEQRPRGGRHVITDTQRRQTRDDRRALQARNARAKSQACLKFLENAKGANVAEAGGGSGEQE